MYKINFGVHLGVFGTRLVALMAFDTLLARRLALEPATTPGARYKDMEFRDWREREKFQEILDGPDGVGREDASTIGSGTALNVCKKLFSYF